MVNLRRVSWMTGMLVLGLALVAAYAYKGAPRHSVPQVELAPRVEIPHREFLPDEYSKIQDTFWTKIQGKDRQCAETFVFAYMDTLRRRCELQGEGKDIGGGCAHLTNAMNYPEVLQAGLVHCGIKYSIHVPRPNNSFKPNPLRGSA